jgi:hypothetical protein
MEDKQETEMIWTKLKKLPKILAATTAIWASSPDWLPAYTHVVVTTPNHKEDRICFGFGCSSRDPGSPHWEDRMPAPLPVGPP